MNSSSYVSAVEHDSTSFSYRLLAEQLVAIVLVLSLALLPFGPMLDHHFAERHPGHHHLYLGMADSQHGHDFQSSHVHDDSWMYEQPKAVDGGYDPSGIVFLFPGDGMGIGSADMAVPPVKRSVRFPGGDRAALLNMTDVNAAVLIGTSIAPPTRPPRA